ncbi:DUF212 domain-containing protein [Cephalotus follicularis]|uniref:DUF212 domain-containing protein n=1 Tax=Cephalotus follicularis TaxID=3775 RepID=A0A1Q3BAF5_CEPFO|nr:DUF212 domain-containing protein [Cephalotus follicularis]
MVSNGSGMSLLLTFSSFHPQIQTHQNCNLLIQHNYRRSRSRSRSRSRGGQDNNNFLCLVSVGLDDIAQIAHNKVLIAAGVSAAIGQLSKPFTSSLLYDRQFDFNATFQSGGFPSTHSSTVVATATSLALERGFSDSIFGLSVVYASLVMYDAQGVRREVGSHARALNKVLPNTTQINSMVSKDRNSLINSHQGTSSNLNTDNLGPNLSKEATSSTSTSTDFPLLLKADIKLSRATPEVEEGSERTADSMAPFKESIGHSEVEVLVGALLGVFVSFAVNTIL